MSFSNSIGPDQLTLLATLIGIILSNDLDSDELNALGNFIELIGQAVLTIAAQQDNLESLQDCNHKIQCLSKQIEQLNKQIQCLKQR